ncbi:8-amino-7-oxononanoate synthase [Moraxella nasovis]|uniref:aminotransferase class I/II-fold pyridoxal phosphate-dependent enzyme n=1 Tax=Moraxella nasovis TaxID=2904121 RepID=UPI001F6067C6|nr:8-amino-7-oxononanoate synthase [Moraxella nasovis]UNU73824.1 8-amino-7-oxononanoate synthase [Moraxella nasovis]
MNTPLANYTKQVNTLKSLDNYRELRTHQQSCQWINQGANHPPLLNLASNDYLGIAQDGQLQQKFFDCHHSYRLSASSSRLLTGSFDEHMQLEALLGKAFSESGNTELHALTFNSGYHANIGILPAIGTDKTLILADKLVHASIIDGVRLAKAKYLRYRHQDLDQLKQLLDKYAHQYDQAIIVTESIFSMDGDVTDLQSLVALKHQYPNVLLYVDEAHGIGVRGVHGLGVCQEQGVIDGVDFIVGAFGKAIASVGGYVICHVDMKAYLINTMRSLIFSTALPPLNAAWTAFTFSHIITMQDERETLAQNTQYFIQKIKSLGLNCPSNSHITPIIVGSNHNALTLSKHLKRSGIFALAVRPPTVPQNAARLRICLNSLITKADIDDVLTTLKDALPLLDGRL